MGGAYSSLGRAVEWRVEGEVKRALQQDVPACFLRYVHTGSYYKCPSVRGLCWLNSSFRGGLLEGTPLAWMPKSGNRMD